MFGYKLIKETELKGLKIQNDILKEPYKIICGELLRAKEAIAEYETAENP